MAASTSKDDEPATEKKAPESDPVHFAQQEEAPKPAQENSDDSDEHQPTELEKMMANSWDSSDEADMDNLAKDTYNNISSQRDNAQKGSVHLSSSGMLVKSN